MSNSGLVIHNDSGSVQVTSDYSNMFLDRIESHNINLNSKPLAITQKVDEIVCVKVSKTPSPPTILANTYISNGGIAGHGYVGKVDAYIFKDRPINKMIGGDVGMEVYTANGMPAYNTKDKPLRVIGKHSISSGSGNLPLPHDDIGVVMINPKITAIQGSGGTNYAGLLYLSCFIRSGELVFTTTSRGWIYTPEPVREIMSKARFLLIDLKNYG